jgi:excisionase family DNA binding protein
MEEQKLTVTQAAKRLGVSPPTVRRLIQERVLTAERAGLRKWVIPESALSEYMAARRSEARQPVGLAPVETGIRI